MPERQPLPCIALTEREQLYDQVSHTRFIALLLQPDIDIHEIKEDTNSFGSFVFVTLSCRDEPQKLLTMWGCGYHEHRERWITDSWQWYESYRKAENLPVIPKEEALAHVKDREAYVRANASPSQPSRRAQLYELLADVVDEDGALSELEDLENLGWVFLSDDADENDTR
jgi:hypothetical protein